jgi:hypothetical protein
MSCKMRAVSERRHPSTMAVTMSGARQARASLTESGIDALVAMAAID